MKARVLFLLSILGACVFPWPLHAQDSSSTNRVRFDDKLKRVSLALPTLIEGSQVKLPIRLENGSSNGYTDLLARVECKCVRVEGIEGESIAPEAGVDFEVVVLPTYQQLTQQITILGVPNGSPIGEAVILTQLGLSAKVLPPFQTTGGHLSRGDSDELQAVLQLKRNTKGIELLTDKISFGEDFLKLDSIRSEDDTHYWVNVTATRNDLTPTMQFWATIRLPVIDTKTRVERTLEERVHFSIESPIDISPRFVRFKEQDQTLVGRFVIKDYRNIDRSELGKYRAVLLRQSGRKVTVLDVVPTLEISALGNSVSVNVVRVKLPSASVGSDRKKLLLAVAPSLAGEFVEDIDSSDVLLSDTNGSYFLLETSFPNSLDRELNDE